MGEWVGRREKRCLKPKGLGEERREAFGKQWA